MAMITVKIPTQQVEDAEQFSRELRRLVLLLQTALGHPSFASVLAKLGWSLKVTLLFESTKTQGLSAKSAERS
jgi:hypothetical protein